MWPVTDSSYQNDWAIGRSATESAKLRRGAWNRSHLYALKPVLPALLPGRIGRHRFVKVFPGQKALKTATGGGVTDNQDPSTLPSERRNYSSGRNP